MSSRVVRGLLTHFSDVHLVVNASIVASIASIAGVTVTAIITSTQYYFRSQAKEDPAGIKKDIKDIKDTMFKREDIKELVSEVARQSPCIGTRKTVYPLFPRYFYYLILTLLKPH